MGLGPLGPSDPSSLAGLNGSPILYGLSSSFGLPSSFGPRELLVQPEPLNLIGLSNVIKPPVSLSPFGPRGLLWPPRSLSPLRSLGLLGLLKLLSPLGPSSLPEPHVSSGLHDPPELPSLSEVAGFVRLVGLDQ